MAAYTRYLAAVCQGANRFAISVFDGSPTAFAQAATEQGADVRFSPILPAYLSPNEGPPPPPANATSVGFLFSSEPYRILGLLKADLTATERALVHFSEGLASVVLFNFTLARAQEIRAAADNCPLEWWQLENGILDSRAVQIESAAPQTQNAPPGIRLPSTDHPEMRVYAEQISASLASLWASYGLYFPSERDSLVSIAAHVTNLLGQYDLLRKSTAAPLSTLKDSSAITSALVEVSAGLSYAVAQGTSGCSPILSHRSPFPHHSLLGIGGAVRAITKFTRSLEAAFMTRSAGSVIENHYSTLQHVLPGRISQYNSGSEYKFSDSKEAPPEPFDLGGDFQQEDQVPLIAYFSLRHGFSETKYSVTAASEALTAEALPQWTLMTLSHEIMHSRVRTIFQALFGKTWNDNDTQIISKAQFDAFSSWCGSRKNPQQLGVATGLRNVILYFCYALEKFHHPSDDYAVDPAVLTLKQVNELYCRHKYLARELLVQFHDYYFVYARQPKLYVRSLWASWIKVAGPHARPNEYLTRSLACVACGTGFGRDAAYNFAKDVLLEGLLSLEQAGVRSPLFEELRRLTSQPAEHKIIAHFAPCYYFIDTMRRYFASRTIAAAIDRIDSDPFSEGSTAADDYTANIYVYGEGEKISPIRYLSAMLFRGVSKQHPIDDTQWLSAWNYMVLS